MIGSDNGLSPGRCQAIIWTTLGTNFSEISIEVLALSFKKMRLACRLRNGDHFVSAAMYHQLIVDSYDVCTHGLRGCFNSNGQYYFPSANDVHVTLCLIVRNMGKIDRYPTATKHSKVLAVCIFRGMYCMLMRHSTHNNSNMDGPHYALLCNTYVVYWWVFYITGCDLSIISTCGQMSPFRKWQ